MTPCVGHYIIWYVIWLLLGHYVACSQTEDRTNSGTLLKKHVL
jgi:hypothetical protein